MSEPEAKAETQLYRCAGRHIRTVDGPLCDYEEERLVVVGNGGDGWRPPCPKCGHFFNAEPVGSGLKKGAGMTVFDLAAEKEPPRIASGFGPLDDCLGGDRAKGKPGGFVEGSLVVLVGAGNSGKTTLTLSACGHVAKIDRRALYYSTEESAREVANTAKRIGMLNEHVLFVGVNESSGGSATVEDILEDARKLKPKLLIVDSLTECRSINGGDPGSASSNLAVLRALRFYTKRHNLCTVVICQIANTGMAKGGGTAIEHACDQMLTFYPCLPDFTWCAEEESNRLRVLSVGKNRRGASARRFMLQMTDEGLVEMVPSEDGHRGRRAKFRAPESEPEVPEPVVDDDARRERRRRLKD